MAAPAFSSATPIAVSIADGTSVTALITAGTAPTALTGEVASVIPVDTAIFVAAIPMSSDVVAMASGLDAEGRRPQRQRCERSEKTAHIHR